MTVFVGTRLRYARGKDLDTAFPEGDAGYYLVKAKEISWPVRWSFLLFAFTLPFQAADLVFMSGSLSLAKISGILFFIFYYLDRNPLIHKSAFPPRPTAMWWFLSYVAIYTVSGLFIPAEFFSAFLSRFITLAQLVILLWFASDVLVDEKIARVFFFAYSIGALIFALGVLLQVPGFAVTIGAERITALGNNPNSVGQLMALGSVTLLGLSFNAERFWRKILLLALILPLIVVMVETGSRGGVLAFVAGSFVYWLLFWRSKRRVATVVLGSFCLAVLVYVAVSNPVFSERVEESYYEGNLAARESIYPVAISMIIERPIFGWHPVELWYELNVRLGWNAKEITDTHNLFLHLLAEVGLVGAIPFLVGLGLCCRAAWKARSGDLSVLPLALLAVLLLVNMSGTGIIDKELWVVLALALAAEANLSRKSRRRFVLRVSSRHGA